MFKKRILNRKFDYQPRFYDALSDESERKKKRLGFSRKRKINKGKSGILRAIIIVILIIFAMILMSKY